MKFDKEKMRLYAITDRRWLNGRSLKEVVKESLDGGVTFLQLRDKCGNCFEDECRWCSCRAE